MEKIYYNLTNQDISKLIIKKKDTFECVLTDLDDNIYDGFKLFESEKGLNYIVCDVSFQKSSTDKKYQARLKFRKTDSDFKVRNVKKGSDENIISFEKGTDGGGYRAFWKMITFLYKWEKIIDLGEFEDFFTITDKDASKFLKEIINIKNKEIFVQSLRILSREEILDISDLVNASKLHRILKIWEENKNNYNEDFWQGVFQDNVWILEQIFATPYTKIGEKFYCGGKEDNDKGGVKGDLLYQDNTKNIAFIEIKTPEDSLIIGGQYRGAGLVIGVNSIYSINTKLTGAVNQVLNQRKEYLKLHQEKNGRLLNNSKCVVIIGITPKENVKIKSFDLYRNSLRDVEIITYNELFQRIYNILEIFESK